MFIKLALLSLCALALAKPHIPGGHQPAAAKYPAGVSPHECPNFPFCDNARLHKTSDTWQSGHHQSWPADGSWHPMNDWNSHGNSWDDHSSWNGGYGAGGYGTGGHGGAYGGHGAYGAHGAHGAHAGGDKYPAGVNPHTCPNYPFCDIHAGGGHAHVAPLPGWTERKYPAGVSPHSCPNFPYCH